MTNAGIPKTCDSNDFMISPCNRKLIDVPSPHPGQ